MWDGGGGGGGGGQRPLTPASYVCRHCPSMLGRHKIVHHMHVCLTEANCNENKNHAFETCRCHHCQQGTTRQEQHLRMSDRSYHISLCIAARAQFVGAEGGDRTRGKGGGTGQNQYRHASQLGIVSEKHLECNAGLSHAVKTNCQVLLCLYCLHTDASLVLLGLIALSNKNNF